MDIINKSYTPFNSPIEYGLRCILILEAFYPTKLDLQDLVYYDYLLIHSADAGGPESVHPATPHRTTEITIKRDILEKSLFLMYSKNIINIEYSTEGILYSGNEETSPFINLIRSNYVHTLRNRAEWLLEKFNDYSSIELANFFNANIQKWGGEFEQLSLAWEE